jgi:Rieske Fe-S protein
VQPEADSERRELMRQAACVAGAWLACGAVPSPALGATRAHPRSLLVDARGDALPASRLAIGEAYLFNYPYTVSPVFLLALERAVEPAELATEDKRRYAAPAGVGPKRSIVAFSAICAHKLMYPTPEVSFIGLRKGSRGEPAQVIHCCGDDSRYDPQRGARVLAGPAPQPLAAVLLEWDAASDRLHAVGTRGGELFDAFFDKYAVKLELENGSGQRKPSGDTTVVRPAASFSRNWRSCPA